MGEGGCDNISELASGLIWLAKERLKTLQGDDGKKLDGPQTVDAAF